MTTTFPIKEQRGTLPWPLRELVDHWRGTWVIWNCRCQVRGLFLKVLRKKLLRRFCSLRCACVR
jgi:hypothetical protein